MDPGNLQAKFQVRSFIHSWDNRVYLKTLGSPWIRPRYLFCKIFNGLLFGWTLWKSVNVLAQFEVCSFTRSWANSAYLKTLCSPWICRSRLFKVTDFGTNRKRVYAFLLVRNSNLSPILHRFGDIAGFLRSRVTPPLFHPILGVFTLHQIAHVGVRQSRGLKLFGREIIFEEFQPMWSRYLNVTDRRTDGRTIYDRNTALCTKVHRAVKRDKISPKKQKYVSVYCWVIFLSTAVVEVAIKVINASLTQNQCLQCVTPPWTHVGIPRPRDATELNNDSMIKSGDVVHYQSPTEFINFSDKGLINDDSSVCSHNLLAIDLQCHVFTFEKLLLNVRVCL